MKNILKKTALCATLLSAFGMQGMKENKSKPTTKDLLKQITCVLKFNNQFLHEYFNKNLVTTSDLAPLQFIMPDGSKEIAVRGQLKNSEYFKTLFNLHSNFGYDKSLCQYAFDKNVPLDAAKIIVNYFKGTDQYTKKEILESDYMLDIVGIVNELQIKPLLNFLTDNILEVLINKGFIGKLFNETGKEKFEETLDACLCGHLDDILNGLETNPTYFDWENPITIQFKKNVINSATQSTCGRYIATASDNKSCHIYDTQTNQTVAIIQDTDAVKFSALSPCRRYNAYVAAKNTCRIYNGKIDQTVAIIQHAGGARFVTWSPDDYYVATISNDNTCRIFKAPDKQGLIKKIIKNGTSSLIPIKCLLYKMSNMISTIEYKNN